MKFKVNKKMIIEESRILRGIGGTTLGAGLGSIAGGALLASTAPKQQQQVVQK